VNGDVRFSRGMVGEMTEIILDRPQERFQVFFKSDKYRQRISQMALNGETSLVLDFNDLLVAERGLAEGLLEEPEEFLEYGSNAAFDQLQIQEPEYAESIKEQGVTIGIVIRATNVRPLVTNAVFRCKRCGETMEIPQTGNFLTFPSRCANPTCRNTRSFELVQEESEFVDSQQLRIQEYPEELPPGQTPRSLDIQLVGRDIVDVARPGDRVSVVGIVRAEPRSYPRTGKLRAFGLYIDANFIDTTGKEPESLIISPEEEEQILKIMYLLFGGVPKSLPDIRIRGELNILLVGDPGTAKSQLLRYVPRIAPRGLYTSGRGTTAAGLTAAVLPTSAGGMTLEAGALVLADRGIACIDEMDKMRPDDRVAIHEAMEQHTISIAKGGIVATLNARAAILRFCRGSI